MNGWGRVDKSLPDVRGIFSFAGLVIQSASVESVQSASVESVQSASSRPHAARCTMAFDRLPQMIINQWPRHNN